MIRLVLWLLLVGLVSYSILGLLIYYACRYGYGWWVVGMLAAGVFSVIYFISKYDYKA